MSPMRLRGNVYDELLEKLVRWHQMLCNAREKEEKNVKRGDSNNNNNNNNDDQKTNAN